ncbi:MAG: LysM peptidoglycan-binding domain-containing protein [Actinomycetota bacterium]|nr:LysM peptidoglycan-binding domain-containing protein [Actinomycetota bacterium]
MSTAVVDIAPHPIRARHLAPVPTAQRAPRPVASSRSVASTQASVRGAQADTRLTRRGRLVLLTLALVLAFAVFTVLSGPAMSTGDAHHPAPHSVVVASGETLWSIAQRIAPGQDPRDVIAEIVDLNALSDAGAIRVGQKLFVPAG